MKAMILAAGLGRRLHPLTQMTPKPLLRVGKHALIKAGITEVVINVSYKAEAIQAALGDGTHYGMAIHYSEEPSPLETGGGVVKALPFLGKSPFILVSSDIYTDFDYAKLMRHRLSQRGHLVLVPNPDFHPNGDFGLDDKGVVTTVAPRFTYGNIALLDPALFEGFSSEFFPLAQVLHQAIARRDLTGVVHRGRWFNVGTHDQWRQVCAACRLETLL